MSRPFLDAYSASISDGSIWHCQFKNTLSDFLSAVGVSRHVDLINVTQLESRFHYLDHCGYNMRNKGPIQLYWVNSRLFASFHLFKRCRFSFSWWDWKLLLTVMIQMHQGQHVKRCSIDSRCFVEAHRPEVVQRLYFFSLFFFFLSCRCPQIHPVCILRNCFSSPSTCRYGTTLTSTGHLQTLSVKMQSLSILCTGLKM